MFVNQIFHCVTNMETEENVYNYSIYSIFRFLSLFKTLVKCGFTNQPLGLSFTQSTLVVLDKCEIKNISTLCEMWKTVTKELIDLVNQVSF